MPTTADTPYRREFTARFGCAKLRETATQVHLIHWKPLPPDVVRLLSALHGKPIALHTTTEDSPLARIARAQLPGGADPGADGTFPPPQGFGSPEDRYLQMILEPVVDSGATDCSFWPEEEGVWRVTSRVQGLLSTVVMLPAAVAERLVRHITRLAELDIVDEHSPQDGIVEFPWLPQVRLRVAVIGTGFARVLALRILSRQVPALPALGYPRPALLTLLDALRGRSGLVLFAGPTGSGKTTGIASFMSLLAAGGRKIVTLEDPIEYRIPGTLQIERGGRHITGREISAALRQDPDILVLGEARSRDQAQQMGQALRSGHLVVTSVHATGRRGTKGRLHELGIPDGALRETRALCCQTMEGQPRRLQAQCWMYPWRDQHER